MLYTRCTVHDGEGGTCGTTDICALVQTYSYGVDGRPVLVHEHRVCFDHRRQTGLPEQDVALMPDGTHELTDT